MTMNIVNRTRKKTYPLGSISESIFSNMIGARNVRKMWLQNYRPEISLDTSLGGYTFPVGKRKQLATSSEGVCYLITRCGMRQVIDGIAFMYRPTIKSKRVFLFCVLGSPSAVEVASEKVCRDSSAS